MRDEAARSRVQHRIVRREPAARCSSRRGSRFRSRRVSPSAPIIAMYIHEIGRIDAEPYGAADTAPMRPRRRARGRRAQTRSGQELREVRAHRDRTDARSAAAVRNAERLVQIQVRDVAAELARRRAGRPSRSCSRRRHRPGRRARCTISQISLHARLEHAVRRRIRDHHRGEIVARAARPSPPGRRDRRCPSSSHATTTTCMPAICADAGLVPCARRGNQADVAMRLAARLRDTRWMISRPAYSPCEPAFGCSETAA